MKTITEEEYMELLEILKVSFRKIDDQFADIQEQFADLKKEINKRFDKIDQRLDYHEIWLKQIESNMAYKSQFKSLLIILEKKNIISNFDTAHIMYDPPKQIS